MFVNKLLDENLALLDFSFDLHNKGLILPDTYLLDVDQIIENGKKIIQECNNEIKAYFMLKQIGRNPYIGKRLMEIGFTGAVAVDFKDCRVLMENNIPIAHAGHLVQIPTHFLPKLMKYGVTYITVYSYDKAKEISDIATSLGITQKVFLKTFASKENMYMGQYSGFETKYIAKEGQKIQKLPNVNIEGLTTFPAFLYNEEKRSIVPTENLGAVHEARQLLQDVGIDVTEINIPSSNCVQNVNTVKTYSGTIIEPGHALTGTTMMHSEHTMEEKIAYLYLTEVSHSFNGYSAVYGGGYYPRGHVGKAIVGSNKIVNKVLPFTSESIDYYLQLDTPNKVGAPVAMCFRTQMFCTRSDIALVKGLQTGNPVLIGLYDSQGRLRS